MKIMGLDVGSKTIGVAISDELGWTAQGLTTIKWDENDIHSADSQLKTIIDEHNISKVVIGLPKNMNGTIGERGEASQRFAAYIEEKYNLQTILWDERLTTMAAERVLLEADVSRKKRKKVIDKMAAMMILQGYLDQK
ncbi:Holliday junction resolvase RuvX [Ornithinibacillus sp. BX22]|uniref:Putative pre-16S rRNA nuclease n=2 Tax=Ornithinibacillus TaxID=484508 RepID=A0A923L734_9BACI|nr:MULTISPECIES: Holliday junction resolvase RuvX [Ornithinibacillus]MBC5637629.1 Holliday junction resolvase RuvX [Ornithinibacillus hominis]MBS3679496.1 Holliday junction resolvase RuvX [Ornithinibacillus massiliensis]